MSCLQYRRLTTDLIKVGAANTLSLTVSSSFYILTFYFGSGTIWINMTHLQCPGFCLCIYVSVRLTGYLQRILLSISSVLGGIVCSIDEKKLLTTFCLIHREQEQRGIQVWDFCEESSVAAAAGMLDCFKELKQGSTVNDLLRHVVTPLQSTSSMTGPDTSAVLFSKTVRSQFRQDGLSLSDCISNGPFSYQISNVIENSSAVLSPPQCEDRWESPLEDVVLALRGPANCSDTRRRTPLHIAASRGDTHMIAGLLAIGATVKGAKDSSGATALFVAAESGYAHVCELLLRGGADVLASNRLGETPLYIAALRGHSAAVGIMLAHCHERGVNWQAADVYGMPLLSHIVPSLGWRNFTRRSSSIYCGTGLPFQSPPVGYRTGVLPSGGWEWGRGGLQGSQVGYNIPFFQIHYCNPILWRTTVSY